MSDVTRILDRIENGDSASADELLPLVYNELRSLAAARMSVERPDHTLQATALVHEAFIKLVHPNQTTKWDSRGHFFAAAAEAMRRLLINRARDRNRLKRGGGRSRIDLDQIKVAMDTPADDLLALDEALSELTDNDPVCGELVKRQTAVDLCVEMVRKASVQTMHRIELAFHSEP